MCGVYGGGDSMERDSTERARPSKPHIVHVAPPEPAGRPRPLASPSTALLPGAVLVLALLVVFLPVPADWSAGFGTAYWMTRVFAAATVVALLLGLGSQDGARAAAFTATLGALFGFFEYVGDEARGRAQAPLAACLCCAAAALLCAPLIRRSDPWLALGASRPHRALRRRVRMLGALLLVGACMGGLFGTGAFLFAYQLRTEYGPKPPRVESQTVPEGERDSGAAEDRAEFPRASAGETWNREFPNPVGLSVCGNGERDGDDQLFRGTLVGFESEGRGSAVLGLDAATGKQRWRFTVRDPGGVHQVAVSEGCAVLVIHGEWLTALDSYDGSVRGRSPLPAAVTTGWPDGWQFITATAQGDDPPKVVTLPGAELAYVRNRNSGLLAVDRTDAAIVGRADDRGSGCGYVVDQSGPRDPGTMLISRCAEGQLSAVELREPPRADSALPPLLFDSRPELTVPPPPGCEPGWAATAVDVRDVAIVTVEDTCGMNRMWVGRIGLRYGYDSAVTWTAVPGVPGGQPGAVSGLSDVLLLPAADGIRLIDAYDMKRQDLYRLGKGEQAESIVEVRTENIDIHRQAYYLVQTTSGRIHLLRQESAKTRTGTRLVEQTPVDTAGSPCPGTRTLLRDQASGTILSVCTSGTLTRVRALRP